MTVARTKKPTGIPWWESELPRVVSKLKGYLGKKLPMWRVDHEDLVSETLLALTGEMRGHKTAYPKSWFASSAPKSEDDRAYLSRLALTILRRRIADLFRHRARSTSSISFSEQTIQPYGTTSQERRALLLEMVRIALSVLANTPPSDRDLLALTSHDARIGRALTAGERQRIHRLRLKLRNEIERKMGSSATALLKNSE
jgi:DNA-directed RNA polymerase specialized sigma24 family protein